MLMRKLMAMLAMGLVVVAPTTSWGLVGLESVKFDGSLEISGNSANNEADLGGIKNSGAGTNDHRGTTVTRVRLGMNSTITEGVNGRLELLRNPSTAGSKAFYGGSGKPTSVQNETDSFEFTNAYAEITNLWAHNWRIGRQYVGEKNDLIWHIGPKSDDALSVNSIDGLLIRCPAEAGKGAFGDRLRVTLFTGKAAETATSVSQTDASSSGDVNLNNIEARFNLMPEAQFRAAYLIGDSANTNAASDNNHLKIYRIAVNGGFMDSMINYNAEFLGNQGQQNAATAIKYKGTAIDLGLGVNAKETALGGLGAKVSYFMASGDSNTSDNDDKSFHDFSLLGVNTSDRYFGEIFGKSSALAGGTPLGQGVDGVNTSTGSAGLSVFSLCFTWTPKFVAKTTVDLDYYLFSRAEDSVNNTNIGSKYGSEIDFTVRYSHTDNVGFDFGFATLKPDEALSFKKTGSKTGTQEDAVNKLFARANIMWGGE